MTINKQTAKLVARIAENLPDDMDDTVMQGWIDNPKGVRKFLAGLCPPTRSWREEDNVIYFSVESDGTTGEDWITRFKDNDFNVEDYVRQVLCSPDFKPTFGVTTEVVVPRGLLFEDNDRITKNIRAEGALRKLVKPSSAELACLIRLKFTDKEIEAMGLWFIVAMHEPIKDSGGTPRLLGAHRGSRGGCGRGLGVYHSRPDEKWVRNSGFAFAASQFASQFSTVLPFWCQSSLS